MKVLVLLTSFLIIACTSTPEPKEAKGTKDTLFSRLGGKPAIEAVVGDFVDGLAKDTIITSNERVAEVFKVADVPALKVKVVNQICAATGGPCEYKGATMSDSHKNLQINEKQWKRMGNILVRVLKKYKVPKKERKELLSIIKSTKKDIVTVKN